MEIRCSQCQHVGPAADVRPTAEGVVLVCENCGAENRLDVSRSDEDSGADGTPETPPVPIDPGPASASQSAEAKEWMEQGALERLIPEPGTGPRCRKCAHLLGEGESYCPRCGLSVSEANRYPEGEAPWEKAPPDKEAEHEQATLLWRSLQDHPTDENLSKFAEFARDEELLEYGVRKLRRFLIEHPDNERAIEYLRELASSFQARVIVAQAQAQIRADDFVQKTGQFKQILLWVVFVVWGGIFFAFLLNVMDGCT